MTTKIFKDRILREINEFMLNDNMIALAKAQVMIEEILKKENFPFRDYKRKLAPYPFQSEGESEV